MGMSIHILLFLDFVVIIRLLRDHQPAEKFRAENDQQATDKAEGGEKTRYGFPPVVRLYELTNHRKDGQGREHNPMPLLHGNTPEATMLVDI